MSKIEKARWSIGIFVVLSLCSCGFNVGNYTRAVKSGFSKIPEAMQIESLFGEADHFISYSGPNVPQVWNTVAYFGDRYVLTMQVEVKTNSSYGGFSEVNAVIGEPRFYLREIDKITVSPGGSVETSYSRGGGEFGVNEWKQVLVSKGDFSVIGITVLKNHRAPNVDAYVKAWREPRIRVRPDE